MWQYLIQASTVVTLYLSDPCAEERVENKMPNRVKLSLVVCFIGSLLNKTKIIKLKRGAFLVFAILLASPIKPSTALINFLLCNYLQLFSFSE